MGRHPELDVVRELVAFEDDTGQPVVVQVDRPLHPANQRLMDSLGVEVRRVSAEQLNLLGDAAQPVDDELGPVQRAVMRTIRHTRTMSWDEAGALAHFHRGKHAADERCEGDDILDAPGRGIV